MTDRKKPGVAFWATVVVVVAVAYPLSAFPMLWLREYLPNPAQDAVRWIYTPLHWFVANVFGVGNG